MRKRVFATSVVVTVAMGDVACKSKPINENPPGPIIDETTPPDPEPEPETEPEPEPEPDSGPDSGATPDRPTSSTKIVHNEDGTCTEYVSVDCPPGMACNPPPPREVPCPEEKKAE
jgi:hypothetical protein